ncbi:MAG: dTDP-4-dehydrorhamnose 3,5-epimerase [bacterium]|nr:dTDP-4-dehydrorhamnose 3,5-epimerase [bacterium]
MKFKKTKIKDVYIIEPELKKDKRGYFFRAFCKKENKDAGIHFDVVQANRSFTRKRGTIRGLHYQTPPYQEDKIMYCLRGKIYVVVLDLRRNSSSFGKWLSFRIGEKNKNMILVPKGCCVGIQTLTDKCEILYYMSEYYTPEYYTGIRWDDPAFKIKWPIKKPFLSEKDKNWEYY